MPTLLKTTTEKKTNAQLAKEFLRERGIPVPRRPSGGDELRLPDSLDGMAAADVTEEMLKWSRMLAYVKAELSLCEIRHREADDTYTKRRKIELMRLREVNGPRSTVKDLEAQIDTNEKFVRMAQDVAVLDAKKRLMQAVHDGYDQNYKLLSRELTRRTHSIGDRGLD